LIEAMKSGYHLPGCFKSGGTDPVEKPVVSSAAGFFIWLFHLYRGYFVKYQKSQYVKGLAEAFYDIMMRGRIFMVFI